MDNLSLFSGNYCGNCWGDVHAADVPAQDSIDDLCQAVGIELIQLQASEDLAEFRIAMGQPMLPQHLPKASCIHCHPLIEQVT